MAESELSYAKALKSLDSHPTQGIGNGGRQLLKRICDIGLREEIPREQIVAEMARRLGTSRHEIEAALSSPRARYLERSHLRPPRTPRAGLANRSS